MKNRRDKKFLEEKYQKSKYSDIAHSHGYAQGCKRS